jgi:hypothetical protein
MVRAWSPRCEARALLALPTADPYASYEPSRLQLDLTWLATWLSILQIAWLEICYGLCVVREDAMRNRSNVSLLSFSLGDAGVVIFER